MGHGEQCVERYLELSGKPKSSLRKTLTPCIDDHLLTPDDFMQKGALHKSCSKIVLKIFYLARITRIDLLYSVNMLAREVTKWTIACDKRLHKLICYLHHTTHWSQCCFVGNTMDECALHLFADASFAGDLNESKSTSGGDIVLTWFANFRPHSLAL